MISRSASLSKIQQKLHVNVSSIRYTFRLPTVLKLTAGWNKNCVEKEPGEINGRISERKGRKNRLDSRAARGDCAKNRVGGGVRGVSHLIEP